MQKILSFILTIGLMFSTFFGLIGEKYDVYENLRYGDAPRDLVTVYVPKTAKTREDNGVILIIHGGSWTGGEKEDMEPFCKKIAMEGYITATMSYSLCSDETFGEITVFTMLDEIGLCLGRLKEFSDEKGLNITKCATMGYSAGGHISMLYAYTRADEAPIPLVFTASRVGPSDMTPAAWSVAAYGLASQLTGVVITEEMKQNGEAEALCRSISPVYFVDGNTVPSIFAYAGNDPIVTPGNRTAMVNAFERVFGKNSDRYDYILFPLSGHGLLLDPISEEIYFRTLYRYCETYFGY